jgi:hypothetical protein
MQIAIAWIVDPDVESFSTVRGADPLVQMQKTMAGSKVLHLAARH